MPGEGMVRICKLNISFDHTTRLRIGGTALCPSPLSLKHILHLRRRADNVPVGHRQANKDQSASRSAWRLCGQSTTLKITTDTHGHGIGSHAAHGPEGKLDEAPTKAEVKEESTSDVEDQGNPIIDNNALAQIIGVAILEFGVALHRQALLVVEPK